MHKALVKDIIKNVRQRIADGDHPTVKAYSVEQLEGCVDALARDLEKKNPTVIKMSDSDAKKITDSLKSDAVKREAPCDDVVCAMLMRDVFTDVSHTDYPLVQKINKHVVRYLREKGFLK